VQAAWWSLGYSALLLAIWPVLFVNYLEYLVPWIAAPQSAGAGPVVRWFIAVLVIASAMAVNLRGARGGSVPVT
jgi:amino acid transporter